MTPTNNDKLTLVLLHLVSTLNGTVGTELSAGECPGYPDAEAQAQLAELVRIGWVRGQLLGGSDSVMVFGLTPAGKIALARLDRVTDNQSLDH